MNRKIRCIVAAILAAGGLSTVTALAASTGTTTGTSTLSTSTGIATSTTETPDGWNYPG